MFSANGTRGEIRKGVSGHIEISQHTVYKCDEVLLKYVLLRYEVVLLVFEVCTIEV